MALNAQVLSSYKKIDEAYIDTLLNKEITRNQKKIVVLDDDPTGVQTVHDISVYTNWERIPSVRVLRNPIICFTYLPIPEDLQLSRQQRHIMRLLKL